MKILGEQLSVINLLTGSKSSSLSIARHYYYPDFPWIWDKFSWKKSALVRSKALGLFLNTLQCRVINLLTSQYADFHATSSDCHYLKSARHYFYLDILLPFLNLGWIELEHFQKKGDSSSLSIFEIIDSKRGRYLSAWKALLQNSFR